MVSSYEELYYYYIALKTKFVSFDAYKNWLNDLFLSDKDIDKILLELEWYTNDEEKTIYELYVYLYDKLASLNYHSVVKMVMSELKVKYINNPDSLRELTDKLYEIWCLLPEKISYEEPFFTLHIAGEAWSLGDREQVVKNIYWLFNYYDLNTER